MHGIHRSTNHIGAPQCRKNLKSQSLGRLARFAAMGERALLRRFHQATGLKPSDYFQNVRVSSAQEALEFSTHTVEEITTMVGYRDYSAFRQVFKKVIGLTPTEYRSRFGLVGTRRR